MVTLAMCQSRPAGKEEAWRTSVRTEVYLTDRNMFSFPTMLPNNASPAGEYRHNYLRLVFLIGAVLLFVGHATVNQLSDRGNNCKIFCAVLQTCTSNRT